MSRWLSIVGMGEGGWPELSALGRSLIEGAELVVGGERHLAMLPPTIQAKRLSWVVPLTQTVEEILRRHGRPVAVLATGDPMHFGIGVTLARAVPMSETLVLPGVSAFSLAAARLGWPIAECECLTLHGRPLARFAGFLYPGARLLLLSHDGTTPAQVAAELVRRGFGGSRLILLEHMGGPQERILEATASIWTAARTADLNTLAVDCVADPGVQSLPRLPGLPDDAFRHDGQLTKREIRAATLAALAPLPGQRLWDVGAGCGSIAIEWLRAGRDMKAIAVESDAQRRDFIAENANALGTPEIEIVAGEAPQALEGLESPQAIFIGGGIATPGLVERCWLALPSGGRLVANVVTVEGEICVARHRGERGGSLTRIAISRAEPVGSLLGWRPLMPVTQWAAVKP
ncbi:MAG TPA: precorrin-6y C5,15-methyltransferase (decarboxylating) subunit CbiE [Dongiaceae bacterium]